MMPRMYIRTHIGIEGRSQVRTMWTRERAARRRGMVQDKERKQSYSDILVRRSMGQQARDRKGMLDGKAQKSSLCTQAILFFFFLLLERRPT